MIIETGIYDAVDLDSSWMFRRTLRTPWKDDEMWVQQALRSDSRQSTSCFFDSIVRPGSFDFASSGVRLAGCVVSVVADLAGTYNNTEGDLGSPTH